MTEIYDHLAFLYGEERAGTVAERLHRMLQAFRARHPAGAAQSPAGRVSEKDAILITYGDMVQAPSAPPLHTLAAFLEQHVRDTISTVHLLPFYPYSSDDGFSVVDYQAVNPNLGTWDDVARVGRHFRLMFDAVINHISRESAWFQAFLRDDPRYRDYFTVVAPGTDLSQVFRPRALPLLTPVQTAAGEKRVWTTFSDDQIDLNYHNPDVLLDVIDTLLFYVSRGAAFIRLDAIAFMWKEIGTACIHRPETHRIIQLLRTVLDQVAPRVVLITETNVPHEDNVSYFGDGTNEAQMVYNFSLPPLVLHAFHHGNAETLSRWADGLHTPSYQTTFFNFLASHDGIGLTPAKGLLPAAAIAAMAERTRALGGYVSYKSNPDGTESAYELNVNYLDALGDPEASEERHDLVARRFLASQAIMLALRGVPGIYFHSLFGSRNWRAGVEATGRARTINRQKLQRAQLERALADPDSLRHRVFTGYQNLLQARTSHPAFHPNGGQEIVFCHEAVFALWRTSPPGRERILCLHNVSGRAQQVRVPLDGPVVTFTDLLDGDAVPAGDTLTLTLPPYAVRWLQPMSIL